MNDLHPDQPQLRGYAIGELSDAEALELERHLAECPDCEQTLDNLVVADETLLDGLRRPRPNDSVLREPLLRSALERIAALVESPQPAESRADVVAADVVAGDEAAGDLGTIGVYRLLAELGEGGMGKVYKALHTKLKRIVALKVLPAERLRDPHAVLRFEREMEAVGRLDHPHIVRAIDAGEADGAHFLVMEYVAGRDLSTLSRRCGPLPIADACELVRQAAVGLQFAHEQGLVHRDIKPANLMLSVPGSLRDSESRSRNERPTLKILDLGLARLSDLQDEGDGLTSTGQIMGTLDYMAPEQAGDSRHVDIRADIYSLGATLYKLLTGHSIYDGEQFQTVIQKLSALASRPAPPIQSLREDVPDELAVIVHRLLAKDPLERFATPAEVDEALAPHAADADLAALIQRMTADQQQTYVAVRSANGPDVQPPAIDPSAAGAQASVKSSSVDTETRAAPAVAPSVGVSPTTDLRADANARSPVCQTAGISSADVSQPAFWRTRLLTGRPGILVTLAGAAAIVLGAVVFYFQTNHGTLVVEVDDPGVSVTIDGEEMVITGTGAKEIRLKPGQYQVLASKNGDVVRQELVTVTKNGRQVVRVSREGPPAPPDKPAAPASRKPTFMSGDWRREGDELFQAKPGRGFLMFGDVDWTDYDVTVETLSLGHAKDAQGGMLRFRVKTPANFHEFAIGGYSGRITEATRGLNGQWSRPGGLVNIAHEHDRWYKLTVKVRGPKIGCWLDGVQLFDYEDDSLPHGMIGLATHNSAVRFKNLKVTAPDGRALWEGFPELPDAGEHWPADAPRLAVAPFDAEQATRHQQEWADYLGMPVEQEIILGQDEEGQDVKLTLVLIPPGEFLMGSSEVEQTQFLEGYVKAANDQWAASRIPSEGPEHRVRITRPFYLGKYEVTQAQWQAVMGGNPSKFNDNPEHPVEMVSWNDVQPFLAKLNESDSANKLQFALPTEAQWEFACRAGTTTTWHSGDKQAVLGECGWFHAHAGGKTHPVGRLKPNLLGLFDMHGNVWEWCADWFAEDYYAQSPWNDPSGADSGTHRVIRGGCSMFHANYCRSASREHNAPGHRFGGMGFRLAAQIGHHKQMVKSAAAPDRRAAEIEELRQSLPALSPQEQLARVVEKLVEYNPGFDGKLASQTITAKGVEEVRISGRPALVDLSPLRALPKLERLTCNVTGIADLAPLKGMSLKSINGKPVAEFWKEIDN